MCFISDGSFDEMIQSQADDGKARRRLMPKQLAFKVIDQAAQMGVPALKFNWRGESTIHPSYAEIIRWATAQENWAICPREPAFLELLANTNGNCKPHAIDGLMFCTKVMVSLDSMNPITYLTMRRGGNFDLVKKNIWKLVKRGHPNVWVRRVITKENEKEDFYGQVKQEWGEKVKISEHFCFDRNKQSDHQTGECHHDLERTYCGYPSQRLVVASTGLVYPCCIDLHETMPVGDIRKQTLAEIWNGEPLRRLRGELRKDVFKSKACQSCESWLAYKSPKREYVQDKELKK